MDELTYLLLPLGYVKYRMAYPDSFKEIDVAKIRERVARGQPGVLPHRDNEVGQPLYIQNVFAD